LLESLANVFGRASKIAGVWADGETFGVAEWVKAILDNRASLISAYEQAISLLQQGLDQKWTRGQYLAAVSSKSNYLLPFSAIRSTLKAGRSSDDDPQSLQLAMQALSAYFTQNLDSLQRAKSSEKVPSNPELFSPGTANPRRITVDKSGGC
jgi:hypothetical protein